MNHKEGEKIMDYFRVALLQLLPESTREENLRKGMEECRKAQALGADLALFPEMWSCGYGITRDLEKMREQAVGEEDEFLRAFGNLAKALGMAIGITYLEKFDPFPRNSLRLFDRWGNPVLKYAKVHTCDFDDERLFTPGEDFAVANLDTAKGPLKVGVMICYDREFPESARILMLKGAEILLVPNACPMEINRLAQLRARAFENMVGIATVNYPSGQPDCNGHSTAFDGMAYKPGEPHSHDMLLLEAGEEEGIFLADFPVEELRAYRKQEVWGNAYRHPSKYGTLLEEKIEEPFLRRDDRR